MNDAPIYVSVTGGLGGGLTTGTGARVDFSNVLTDPARQNLVVAPCVYLLPSMTTAQIQAAVDEALRLGLDVMVTDGVYTLTSEILIRPPVDRNEGTGIGISAFGRLNINTVVNHAGLHIYGVGNPVFRSGANLTSMFRVFLDPAAAPSATQPWWVTFENIRFDGNEDSVTTQHGVWNYQYVYRVAYERCRFGGMQYGIRWTESAVNIVDKCAFDCTQAAVWAEDSGDNAINDCEIYVNKIGILLANGSDTRIGGKTLFTGARLWQNGPFTTGTPPSNPAGAGYTANPNTLICVQLQAPVPGGVGADPRTRHVIVDGCEAVGVDWLVWGEIDTTDGIYGCKVINNHVIFNGYRPSAGFAHIKGGYDFCFANNTCGSDSDGVTSTVNLYEFIDCYNFSVVGDKISNTKKYGIVLQGCRDFVIDDCGFRNAPHPTIGTVQASILLDQDTGAVGTTRGIVSGCRSKFTAVPSFYSYLVLEQNAARDNLLSDNYPDFTNGETFGRPDETPIEGFYSVHSTTIVRQPFLNAFADVRDARLGAETSVGGVGTAGTYKVPAGYMMTGVTSVSGGGLNFIIGRPVQVFRNGAWLTVGNFP